MYGIVSTFHILHLDLKTNYSEHIPANYVPTGTYTLYNYTSIIYINDIKQYICVNFTYTIIKYICK